VSLTSNEDAIIYYSTDGNDPSVGGANTTYGWSPVSGLTMGLGTTVLKFFAIDQATNWETIKTETYIVDDVAPAVSFPSGMPLPVGILSETTITCQSDEGGDYVVELGGNGAQCSGEQIAAGTVAANIPVGQTINGGQLSYVSETEVWVYVTDAAGNTGSNYGTASLKPFVTIASASPVGIFAPLLINGAGTRLYVGENALKVVDIDGSSGNYHQVIATPAIGSGNNVMALTPDSTRLYVTASTPNTISVVDTSANTVSTSLSSSTPSYIATTPDGIRAYIINYGSAISVLDVDPVSASYHSTIASIPVSVINSLLLSGKIGIAPNGTDAVVNWTGLTASGVDVIDIDAASPTYNIPIATPVPAINGNSNEVIVSSDSRFAYVNTGGTNPLKKIDLSDYSIAVEIDHYSEGLALSPDGQWLLTGEAGTADLYIMDPENLATVGIVPLVPPIPGLGNSVIQEIAVTPDGTRAYAVLAEFDGVTTTWRLVMLPLQ
jgi:DNA-binding beta-propeller fold protein YncE